MLEVKDMDEIAKTSTKILWMMGNNFVDWDYRKNVTY